MKLIFIGPQGSGKGTQAKIISKKLGICHISTGDLLRNASGELKEKIDLVINAGNLIDDKLMLEILSQRISKPDCQNEFILDGFPRNLKQAEMLDSVIKIDKVIEILIKDEESVKRISGRRNCNNCGAIYNIHTSPKPEIEGICDTCKNILFQREDDNEEAVKKRLEIYHNDTEPIIEKYKDLLVKIDGEKDIEEVSEEIYKQLTA